MVNLTQDWTQTFPKKQNTRHPASGKLFKRKNVVGEITPDTNKKADIDETSFAATTIRYKYCMESIPKMIRFNFTSITTSKN